MKFNLKHDKGVAGLTVLLSLIVMLFVIGLLVMIFALMGGELQDATTDATAIEVINDTTSAISSVTDWYDIFIVIGDFVFLNFDFFLNHCSLHLFYLSLFLKQFFVTIDAELNIIDVFEFY